MLFQKNSDEKKLDDVKLDEAKLIEAFKLATRTYGKIHKATPANLHNNRGFLIWDFLVYNELTFLNAETGGIVSLYHSILDEKMEIMFHEFAEKYGLGINEQKKIESDIFDNLVIHMA